MGPIGRLVATVSLPLGKLVNLVDHPLNSKTFEEGDLASNASSPEAIYFAFARRYQGNEVK